MKNLLLFVAFAGCFSACKQEENAAHNTEISEAAVAEMPASGKQGYGKVELQCGGQILIVDGKCGGVTNTGEMIIAVQDKTVAAKVFTISFNTKDYPLNGKIYTVKKSDFMSEGKKPDSDIYVGFSEVTQKSQIDWSSDDASGTMQFQVSGNEIKCTFSNIKLQPSIVYNKGEMNQVGTASGEITLYKN